MKPLIKLGLWVGAGKKWIEKGGEQLHGKAEGGPAAEDQ